MTQVSLQKLITQEMSHEAISMLLIFLNTFILPHYNLKELSVVQHFSTSQDTALAQFINYSLLFS